MLNCLRRIPAFAVCAFAVALTVSADAGDASRRKPSKEQDGWHFAIGAGGAYAPDYEGSDRYRFRPFPFASVGYGDVFEFSGGELTVPVIRLGRGMLTVGVLTKVGAGRDESDNRADLKGLGDIGTAVEVGGYTRLQLGRIWLNVSAGQDVAGGHKGMVIDSSLGIALPLTSSLTANLSANTTWVSRKYMTRFFGITAAQSVASGLPEFAAESGLKSYGANLGLNYRLSQSWSLNAGAHYARLLNDAADSPLVRLRGSRNQVTSYVAVAYSF
jgi:outer membrane scaffolding protein for murein synthesis (MipA/OmpV family)